MANIPDSLLQEVRQALIADPGFQFKRTGGALRQGTCPNCGEKEAFVSLDSPFRVSCGRLNKCGWSATVRELYPDIFNNLSKRFPPTDDNPNATADAYLRDNRGFYLAKLRGFYSQSNVKNAKTNEYYPSIKVIVNQECYWQRIIDADDVRRNGAKTKIVGDYAGMAWIPPKMTFEQGDEIWITEGIFKSIAFLHIGMKSIAALSASNFPRTVIEQNKGKGITWVVALDNDHAGHKYTENALAEIRKMGEKCMAAVPERGGKDWDDVFRDGNLTKAYLADAVWRAFYIHAGSPQKRAFFHYCRYKRMHYVFEYRDSLFSYDIDGKARSEDANKIVYPIDGNWNAPEEIINDAFATFCRFSTIKDICPCAPEFLYIEQDIITGQRTNCFKITFSNKTAEMIVNMDGTVFKSPAEFSTGLLKPTAFARFSGNSQDLDILHRRWFDGRPKFVRAVSFVGYEADSGIYVFPKFAYYKGQMIKVNEYGYFEVGHASIKTTLLSLPVLPTEEQFDPSWIKDYYLAYDKNGMILLAWWIGTLFAEQVRKKHSSWTFLEYTGDHDTGKSTQIRFLWKCTGREGYEGTDPNKMSGAGRARKIAQTSNLPAVLLEGDRNGDKAKRTQFELDEFKDAFDGGFLRSVGVKNNGLDTDDIKFRGGLLIAQNAEVTGSDALLSRIVHCHCTKEHFSEDGRRASNRLKEIPHEKAAALLHTCLRFERSLIDGFFRQFEILEDEVAKSYPELESRIVKNHAQIAAWVAMLPAIFGKEWIPDAMVKELIAFTCERAKARQERLKADPQSVEKFWDMYEFLNYAKAMGAETVNLTPGIDEVSINLPHFQQVCRDNGMDPIDWESIKPQLKVGRRYKFLRRKTVRSSLLGRPVDCWVFSKPPKQETCE